MFKSRSRNVSSWDSLILLTKVKRFDVIPTLNNLDTGQVLSEKSRVLNQVFCKEKVLWETAKTENLQEKSIKMFSSPPQVYKSNFASHGISLLLREEWFTFPIASQEKSRIPQGNPQDIN